MADLLYSVGGMVLDSQPCGMGFLHVIPMLGDLPMLVEARRCVDLWCWDDPNGEVLEVVPHHIQWMARRTAGALPDN